MAPQKSDSFFQLLAPKHWLMWFVIGLIRITAFFPYSWVVAIGKKVGWVLRKLGGSRVRITRRNLELCFPEKSALEREQLLEKNFEALGVSFLESGLAWWGSDQRILKMATIEGLELVEQRLAQGKKTIMIGFHFVPLEMCARLCATKVDFNALYKPQNNGVFEWISAKRRGINNMHLIPRKKIKYMLGLLDEGKTILLAPDQDLGVKCGIFVPFFGIPAATIPSVSEYARQTNSEVVYFNFYRNPDFSGFTLKFSEPLENFPSGDDYADTARINVMVEEAIRAHPDQYLWQHRRFKNRPEGEEPLYAKSERKKTA